VASQEPDPLNHGLEGYLQSRKLILENFVACWSPSGKHRAVVWVSPHDRPVLPPTVPLVGANHRNVGNWSPGSELEVVGVDRVYPFPGPAQRVEQPEERNRWPHSDEHLIEEDEDRHQNEGVWR
jgi:hypothetical protein